MTDKQKPKFTLRLASRVRAVPKVVNVRVAKLRKCGYQNINYWLAEPDHLYIGRQTRINLGKGEWAYLKKSKWHNPFKCQENKRIQCVEEFRQYASQIFSRQDLSELSGKELGCWCAPQPCHGHILVELYNAAFPPGS